MKLCWPASGHTSLALLYDDHPHLPLTGLRAVATVARGIAALRAGSTHDPSVPRPSLASAVLMLAQRGDATAHRGHMLTDVQVDPLNEAQNQHSCHQPQTRQACEASR
jgi:hypothetical protein